MSNLAWWQGWLDGRPELGQELADLVKRDLQMLILCRKTEGEEQDGYSRLLDESEAALGEYGIPSNQLYDFRRRFIALTASEQVEFYLQLRRYGAQLSA